MRKNCRVWPNGEFSIWEERKSTAVTPPPKQPDYLGLSLLAISHRVALGLCDPPQKRARKGLKGISRLGARTVRNAAFLLEKKYGCDHLTFLTCTLPPVSSTAEYNAGREWSEIVRIFNQGLVRLLAAAGLPPSYVGCTEIQEKRMEERGGLPLHLHIVLPGRKPFGGWAISADQFRELWRRAVVARCPEYGEAMWKASVDCQRVKASAEGYLGKYMTKGAATLSRILAEDPLMSEFIPTAWWCCSTALKRAIGKRITGGYKTAQNLSRDIFHKDSRISYSRLITIELEDGVKIPVAMVGKLSGEGRRKYCHHPGGIIGVDSDFLPPRAR